MVVFVKFWGKLHSLRIPLVDHHITATAQTLQRSANKEENRTRQSRINHMYIYIYIIESRYMIHDTWMHFILESGVVYCCVPVCLPARTSSWVERPPFLLKSCENVAFHLVYRKQRFWRDNGNTCSFSLMADNSLLLCSNNYPCLQGTSMDFLSGTGTTSRPNQAACQCRFNTLIAMSCVATLPRRQEMNGRKGLRNTVGSDRKSVV